MKKLFYLIIVIFLASCSPSLEESLVKNPTKQTTIEIQKNVIDSCAKICTDGSYYYIMENNLVKYKLVPTKNNLVLVNDFFIFAFIAMVVLLIIILFNLFLDY